MTSSEEWRLLRHHLGVRWAETDARQGAERLLLWVAGVCGVWLYPDPHHLFALAIALGTWPRPRGVLPIPPALDRSSLLLEGAVVVPPLTVVGVLVFGAPSYGLSLPAGLLVVAVTLASPPSEPRLDLVVPGLVATAAAMTHASQLPLLGELAVLSVGVGVFAVAGRSGAGVGFVRQRRGPELSRGAFVLATTRAASLLVVPALLDRWSIDALENPFLVEHLTLRAPYLGLCALAFVATRGVQRYRLDNVDLPVAPWAVVRDAHLRGLVLAVCAVLIMTLAGVSTWTTAAWVAWAACIPMTVVRGRSGALGTPEAVMLLAAAYACIDGRTNSAIAFCVVAQLWVWVPYAIGAWGQERGRRAWLERYDNGRRNLAASASSSR
jgi:hypothetical protein